MKTLLQTFAIGLVALLVTSCSGTPQNASLIPNDTILIVSVDAYSLFKKADIEEIKKLKSFKTFKEELKNENKHGNKLIDDFLEDPKMTGINFKKDIFIFSDSDQIESSEVNIALAIKDEDKFVEFIKKALDISEESYVINKGKNYKFIQANNDILGWDNQKAVLAVGASQGKIDRLFSLKKEEQITENKNFKSFYKDKKDVSFWVSLDFASKDYQGEMKRTLGWDFSDSYSSAYLSFDKGQITLSSKNTFNEKMQEKWEKHKILNNKFNEDLLKFVPKKSYAAASISINPVEYYNMLKEIPQFSLVAMGMNMYLGFDVKKIFESLNGNMIFSLTGFRQEKQTITYPNLFASTYELSSEEEEIKMVVDKLIPTFVLALDMKDSSLLEKIISKIPSESLKYENGVFQFTDDNNNSFLAYSDNVVFFTNDEKYMEAFKNGGFGSESITKSEIARNFSKNPMYGFVDLDLKNYPSEVISELLENQNIEAMQFFKFCENYTEKAELRTKNMNSGEFILKVKDTENNSLFAIFKTIDQTFFN